MVHTTSSQKKRLRKWERSRTWCQGPARWQNTYDGDTDDDDDDGDDDDDDDDMTHVCIMNIMLYRLLIHFVTWVM